MFSVVLTWLIVIASTHAAAAPSEWLHILGLVAASVVVLLLFAPNLWATPIATLAWPFLAAAWLLALALRNNSAGGSHRKSLLALVFGAALLVAGISMADSLSRLDFRTLHLHQPAWLGIGCSYIVAALVLYSLLQHGVAAWLRGLHSHGHEVQEEHC